MSAGPHTHWDRYHTRIVKEGVDVYYDKHSNTATSPFPKERLQLICIDCGEIFHEVDVKNNK